MGAQRILALTSKRTEVMECIRRLESRQSSGRGSPHSRLLEGLLFKLEWLNKCIDLEQRQSDPVDESPLAKVFRIDNAA